MANPDSRKVEAEPHDTQSRRVLDHAYRSWWKTLCSGIARQFGAGPPDPEEAVQTAFEKFAKLENPSEIADPRAWLFSAARNYVLDHYRRKKIRDAGETTLEIMEIGAATSIFDAERVLLGKESLAIVERTIRDMPPLKRDVMALHITQDLRSTEIAHIVGRSDTRVRQLVAQGMAELMAVLQNDETDGSD